jgi:hypothetical protein
MHIEISKTSLRKTTLIDITQCLDAKVLNTYKKLFPTIEVISYALYVRVNVDLSLPNQPLVDLWQLVLHAIYPRNIGRGLYKNLTQVYTNNKWT